VHRAVFLDRDNTLIANDGDLGDPNEVRLIDGVPAGLRALRDAGYRLVVVTNQGGVARGRYTEADVDAVHQRVASVIDEDAGARGLIDRFYYCPYHPDATVDAYRQEHPWRKPGPGMLLQAAHDMNLDLAASWMIGDQGRDVTAGQAAGTRTILIDPTGDGNDDAQPTARAGTFADAVAMILERGAGKRRSRGEASARRREGGAEPPVAMMTEVKPEPVLATASPVAAAPMASAPAPDEMVRSMRDLTDELRTHRMRGAEFTTIRMVAVVAQLGALAMAVLGLLQLENMDLFLRWMIGAVVAQLLVITLFVADLKG
jgi:D-glycero-D-manno-heptose 1,7-bisphosphate phosphatase